MDNSLRTRLIFAGLFLGFFFLYLTTCAPHVAPYRDAGEMSSILATLGVAHAPSYPLYMLAGKSAMWLPFGNMAYRANIFSALMGALAIAVFFLVLKSWFSTGISAVSSAAFGVSMPFWELACVSEMYTMGVLCVGLLFYSLFVRKDLSLTAFLSALSLGVRMDLLLLVPVFLFWAWREKQLPKIPHAAAFFFLGATIFLSVLIRSRQDPVVDWSNPDNFVTLFNSITRKSYSGTLDLLSLSYKTGENFFVNMALYGKHVVRSFGWWGCALALLAGGNWIRKRETPGLFLLLFFAVTGPLFIFLANMPPNPHAVAIVEASYLLPDIAVGLALAFGLAELMRFRIPSFVVMAAMIIAVGSNAARAFPIVSKRNNFYARDYVTNVWRSTPPHSVVVFHKDVQLFSLWYAQLIERRRPDVSLVATGLSGSDWYWDMKKRWGTALCPAVSFKSGEGWSIMKREIGTRKLLAGFETDISPTNDTTVVGHGAVIEIQDNKMPSVGDNDALLQEFCLYRNWAHYGETPDFFSTDLIGDMARAFQLQGHRNMELKKYDAARWFFLRAISMNPNEPRVYVELGYMLFAEGKIPEAYEVNALAVEKYKHMLSLTRAYNSIPAMAKTIRTNLAQAYVSLGSMADKMGKRELAYDHYQESLNLLPTPQAYFNLAVLSWNRNWPDVISNLERSLSLNPDDQHTRNLLMSARANAGVVH
jgi:tetratricopeptide (TPR) repeat protein